MFPPSGSDHPAAPPGGGPPDRRGELIQLTHDLAHELQARGGKLLQLGYRAGTDNSLAWIEAPDGTLLALALAVVER